MGSFRESVEALKEAGLADSEILEIMSESVDGKLHGSFSIPKNDANNYKSGHEHPEETKTTNAETPSVSKKEVGAFNGEKHSRNNKSLRQGSPGLHVEREEVPFENPFNQTASPLTISPNKFYFSANMDDDSELAEKVLNGDFSELPKRSPKMAPTTRTSVLKVPKSTKNLFFLKTPNLFKMKSSCGIYSKNKFRCHILKSTFYPSDNTKILAKTTNYYLLISVILSAIRFID